MIKRMKKKNALHLCIPVQCKRPLFWLSPQKAVELVLCNGWLQRFLQKCWLTYRSNKPVTRDNLNGQALSVYLEQMLWFAGMCSRGLVSEAKSPTANIWSLYERLNYHWQFSILLTSVQNLRWDRTCVALYRRSPGEYLSLSLLAMVLGSFHFALMNLAIAARHSKYNSMRPDGIFHRF